MIIIPRFQGEVRNIQVTRYHTHWHLIKLVLVLHLPQMLTPVGLSPFLFFLSFFSFCNCNVSQSTSALYSVSPSVFLLILNILPALFFRDECDSVERLVNSLLKFSGGKKKKKNLKKSKNKNKNPNAMKTHSYK